MTQVLLQSGASHSTVAAGKYEFIRQNELSDTTLTPGVFDQINFPAQPAIADGSTGGGSGGLVLEGTPAFNNCRRWWHKRK